MYALGTPKDWSQNFLKPVKLPAAKAGRKPLARVSTKRAKENVEYEKQKRIWRRERQSVDGGRCEFVVPETGQRCEKKADRNPHHIKRRGKNLCNRSFFMAVCLEHHRRITDNNSEAEKLGYVIREYEKT